MNNGRLQGGASSPDAGLHAVPSQLPAWEAQTRHARRICELSIQRWGIERATILVGLDRGFEAILERLVRFARARAPVLITGETGVGKELFARGLYVSSSRSSKVFYPVNCAQYASEQLLASELFGHRKGSFTGADADRRGIFEAADGGVVFLDEVGDLSARAQAMVLRVLSEKEVVPIGARRARLVDVRVIAATNRDLRKMVRQKSFREDLYFRLQGLSLQIPPLRERGNDWELIADYYLGRLCRRHSVTRTLARDARRALGSYHWPGNVREVKSLVEFAFHSTRAPEIRFADLGDALEQTSRLEQLQGVPLSTAQESCERMIRGEGSFWETLHRPYLERELNRREVRAVIRYALMNYSHGSYKRMLHLFGVGDEEYLKAMDFLRHHQLKPKL